jgi:ATP-dependent RNA helicase DDX10/DBP4
VPKFCILNSPSSCSFLSQLLVSQRYAELYKEMQEYDKEDKLEHKKSLREKKLQKKLKLKRKRQEEAEAGSEEDSGSESDGGHNATNKGKKYFDSDDEGRVNVRDGDVLAQQEALALKLLSKMHS